MKTSTYTIIIIIGALASAIAKEAYIYGFPMVDS